jgi:hypothetical protein
MAEAGRMRKGWRNEDGGMRMEERGEDARMGERRRLTAFLGTDKPEFRNQNPESRMTRLRGG